MLALPPTVPTLAHEYLIGVPWKRSGGTKKSGAR